MTFNSGPMVTPPVITLETLTDEEIDLLIEPQLRDMIEHLDAGGDVATRTIVFSLDLTDQVLCTSGVLRKTDEMLQMLRAAYHPDSTRTTRFQGHLEMSTWADTEQLRAHLKYVCDRARVAAVQSTLTNRLHRSVIDEKVDPA